MSSAWFRTALAVIVTPLVVGCVGCRGGEEPANDRELPSPLTVDWREGVFDGVALRASEREVLRSLGAPKLRGGEQEAAPDGERFSEVGGPAALGTPKPARDSSGEVLRYPRRLILLEDRGVYGFATTSPRAQTREGVGVGDDLAIVKQRFARARCAEGSTQELVYPASCDIVVCGRHRRLVFAGDPIKSIWVLARDQAGLSRCDKHDARNADVAMRSILLREGRAGGFDRTETGSPRAARILCADLQAGLYDDLLEGQPAIVITWPVEKSGGLTCQRPDR